MKNKIYIPKELRTTVRQLRNEFRFMHMSVIRGVQGIVLYDSGNPGPTVGITIHTHGNEPSGLATARYLRTKFDLAKRLTKGRVFVILNNLNATETYLMAKGAEQKRKSRFMDINMNRLPARTMSAINPSAYEIQRAKALAPIWEQLEIALDIHSTSQESLPMIIPNGIFQDYLVRGFPISTVISNITKVQVGKPAIHFYGDKKTRSFGIETGSHENPKSFACGVRCAIAFLRNLGMVDVTLPGVRSVREYKEYFVYDSLMPRGRKFRLLREFAMFEQVQKGQVIAQTDEGDITAPDNGHVLFCPKDGVIKNKQEEALFFTRPV